MLGSAPRWSRRSRPARAARSPRGSAAGRGSPTTWPGCRWRGRQCHGSCRQTRRLRWHAGRRCRRAARPPRRRKGSRGRDLGTYSCASPKVWQRCKDREGRGDCRWRKARRSLSAVPFYRDIGPGSVGSDVEALRSGLERLGMGPVGSGRAYDVMLSEATDRLYAWLTGARSERPMKGIFNPAWFVWLPVPSLVVEAANLQVGRLAPAVGSEIASSASRLVSLAVQPAAGSSTTDLPANPTGGCSRWTGPTRTFR